MRAPGQVLIRGPGNGKVGYCAVNGTAPTASTATPAAVALQNTTRANSSVPVRILINSSKTSVIVSNGGDTLTVPAESYLVAFTPIGGALRQLTGLLPVMSTTLVGASSWLDSDGLPKQLAFGWVGSTGGNVDHHEVSNVKVVSLSSVAQLSVSQLSYTPAGTSFSAGDPIGYVVTPGVVSGGLAETGVVTVTETVPANVKPLAASGTGWVCPAPAGQLITCTNSNGPFATGTSLAPITVTAVATGTVALSAVQASSVVTASSDTGLAGYSNSSPAGTNPTSPTITSLSPTVGSTAGGNQLALGGSNLTGVTSIQIGTTTELAAGTGTTLLKCAGAAAPGCFTVAGSTLVISSMPAHAVGSVSVKVVNLGTSSGFAYGYLAIPGTPVVTATAGVTGATVGWTTPANGGSAITNYSVQGYKNGTLVPALTHSVAVGTNTYAYTGLDAGNTYTFTVAATNALAYGDVGTSNAVVPYTVPAVPLSPSASASSRQAVVSWLAPSSDGSSPIIGYTVTPYLGSVAQTPFVFASANLTQTVTGLTVGGSYQFTVAATNAAGTGPASAKTAAVTINALPTLAIPPPVAGEVGANYSNPAFTATGGTGPFTWSVLVGALPAGLTLSTAGVLSGVPATAASSNFTVQVTDAAGKTASQAMTLAIAPAPVLANPVPPNGQVGVAYSDQLTVQGGTGPFAWSTSAGSLPPGVTIDTSTGLLSGTPSTAASYSFTVSVVDALGQSAAQPLSMVVTASPSLSFPAPPSGQVNIAYSDQLVVTGGTGPYTWSSTGALPAGLGLNPLSGLLAGTPTAAGSYPVTIRVQDSKEQNASQIVTLSIAASPSVTFTPPAG